MKHPIDKLLEKKLIRKAQKGDTVAFDELIYANKVAITQFSFSICRGDANASEEILQLATIKAWKYITRFNMDCSFRTWFYKIARNLFYDMLRSNKRKKFYSLNQDRWYSDPDQSASCEGGVDVHFDLRSSGGPKIFGYLIEDGRCLTSSKFPDPPDEACAKKDFAKEAFSASSKILNKLSKDHSDVLKLREFKEMPYAEIAKELKISEGTVMSRLHYARKNARKLGATMKESVSRF